MLDGLRRGSPVDGAGVRVGAGLFASQRGAGSRPRAAPHAAPPAVRLELLHRVGVRDVTEVHAVDPTGRPLGVTPDVTLLLNQRDLAASIQNGERGGQTRQAAANHDHVRWMILLTGSIDEGPGCHRTKRVLRELGRVPDAVVPGEDQDPRVGGE